ncbi:MAG TPA: hypothetical protein PK286_11030 [Devosia sp.]|nr:hypothetical protein [Devosia sp.]
MSEYLTNQARFVGRLALGLIIFAVIVASIVIYAGTRMPPV